MDTDQWKEAFIDRIFPSMQNLIIAIKKADVLQERDIVHSLKEDFTSLERKLKLEIREEEEA